MRISISRGETIIVDGKIRQQLNSLGKPIHSTKEGIKRFWQWFGESKIVNPQGRPLVMYRGTHNEGVESYGENLSLIHI